MALDSSDLGSYGLRIDVGYLKAEGECQFIVWRIVFLLQMVLLEGLNDQI